MANIIIRIGLHSLPNIRKHHNHTMSSILYYAHDPMCSWCWGFTPTWKTLQSLLPPEVQVHPLLGGLAADSSEVMPIQLQHQIQVIWRNIQQKIPSTQFNFGFWETCAPRRSTYPACRAVISTRLLAPELETNMVDAIQEAYYLRARNPSDHSTLTDLATKLGMDNTRFTATLVAPKTQTLLEREIQQCQTLALNSFPSLALEIGNRHWGIELNYNDPTAMLKQIQSLLNRYGQLT